VTDLLDTIWGWQSGWGEIRTIRAGDVRSIWRSLDAPNAEAAIHDSIVQMPGEDIYYGVMAREAHGERKAKPAWTKVLWADVDEKNVGSRLATLQLVKMLDPNIIVDSGHGFHAYWLLEDLVMWDDASDAMKAIAKTIRGDAVHDASRLLRVPGYLNYKFPNDPRPVSVIRFDVTQEASFAQFAALIALHKARPAPSPRPLKGERLDKLPDWLVRDKIEAIHPVGTRSEASFATCVWLLRWGRTYDEIEQVFIDHPDGIGSKYADLGNDAHRWMVRTLEAAREVV
jgi:hypothetical protein